LIVKGRSIDPLGGVASGSVTQARLGRRPGSSRRQMIGFDNNIKELSCERPRPGGIVSLGKVNERP